MDNPLINVLTRASRKDSIQPSIESVASQTYENYHHIITYETKEMGEYLESIVNLEKTTLVKVPKYKHFPELSFSYNHHNDYTKFLEPNWEFWERKVHINGEGYNKDYQLILSEGEKSQKEFYKAIKEVKAETSIKTDAVFSTNIIPFDASSKFKSYEQEAKRLIQLKKENAETEIDLKSYENITFWKYMEMVLTFS